MVQYKKCSACGKSKHHKRFWRRSSSQDGLQSQCIDCHKEIKRCGYLRRMYGICYTEYSFMLASQGGVCAICLGGAVNHRQMAVDHDGKTGEVRGVLCMRCNLGLGHFLDSVGSLKRAVRYLTKKRKQNKR